MRAFGIKERAQAARDSVLVMPEEIEQAEIRRAFPRHEPLRCSEGHNVAIYTLQQIPRVFSPPISFALDALSDAVQKSLNTHLNEVPPSCLRMICFSVTALGIDSQTPTSVCGLVRGASAVGAE
jgi:hypothetical protein